MKLKLPNLQSRRSRAIAAAAVLLPLATWAGYRQVVYNGEWKTYEGELQTYGEMKVHFETLSTGCTEVHEDMMQARHNIENLTMRAQSGEITYGQANSELNTHQAKFYESAHTYEKHCIGWELLEPTAPVKPTYHLF